MENILSGFGQSNLLMSGSLLLKILRKWTRLFIEVLFDPLLRCDLIHSFLLNIPINLESSIVYWMRERSHQLRVKMKGIGGYLQDTLIIKPNNVSIGDYVTCGGRVFIDGSGSVTIGDNVMLAYGVVITTATHDPAAERMNDITISMPVVIGNNVWIGARAIILPGVKLADGTVIGAGSVVTKSHTEAGTIIVGNPAKFLRHRRTP